MKCINKRSGIIPPLLILICISCLISGCKKEEIEVTSYEKEIYNTNIYQGDLFSKELCVPIENSPDTLEEAPISLNSKGWGLFDLTGQNVGSYDKLFEMVYPASTTKIMTALVALKYGNLDDIVTISGNADSDLFAADEATCGIHAGEQVTLRDLLYGLTLNSGNDTAIAIAEHIGGSVEEFCNLMNQEAKNIMATHSHYTNPHGLHNDDHYTTAYDLYLTFNEAIKYEEYITILTTTTHEMQLTSAEQTVRTISCEPTNLYSLGEETQPTAATVLGGKTGTTKQAGYCLVAYDQSNSGSSYISIVMGANNKPQLYADMTSLIETID